MSKGKTTNDSDVYFEEQDSSRDMPELVPAPVLKDITNAKRQQNVPPWKTEKLDDLSDPSVEELCSESKSRHHTR